MEQHSQVPFKAGLPADGILETLACAGAEGARFAPKLSGKRTEGRIFSAVRPYPILRAYRIGTLFFLSGKSDPQKIEKETEA